MYAWYNYYDNNFVSFYMAECCIPDFHGDHYDDIDHSIWYFEVGGL